MAKRYDNEVVMVMSDSHVPYHVEGMVDFLAEVKAKNNPCKIVHLGDYVDFYGASRYPKDVDHPDSLVNELKKIKVTTKRLAKVFPKMEIIVGNHDRRMASKIDSINVPRSVMKSFAEVVGAPRGWRFHEDEYNFTIDSTRKRVTCVHTRGSNVFLAAQRLGNTLLAGHQHSRCKVEGFSNGSHTYWGANCPTLISNKGCPFAYTKISNINPIRGCMMIEGGVPRLILM